MDNFVVSARKYRPKGFEEVVGQSHITTTLSNAIKNNQLAQAMLFCGPRGVGKTTCARIVARLINGFDDNDEATAMNIFELDAASNNSVDDIRNLIDQVRYPPQQGNYKVYIIDEVHMLSAQAFNAFLKTLEEPPSYAIFILATTEKHKVIPTILSRCQIYDFNRIKVNDIIPHLEKIAELETIKVEPEALHIIAQKADGALRDALSIFDLLVTFSEDSSITYDSAIDNLHILDHDYYFRITDHIIEEDHSNMLLIFDEILDRGFDGHLFIAGLGEHFRNLLVAKDTNTVKLLEVPENTHTRFAEQAAKASSSLLLSGLSILSQCDLNYKNSRNQRLLVELALLKLAHLNSAISLASLPDDQAGQKKISQDVKDASPAEKAESVPEPEVKDEQLDTGDDLDEDELPEVTPPPPMPPQAEDKESSNESAPKVAKEPADSEEPQITEEPAEADESPAKPDSKAAVAYGSTSQMKITPAIEKFKVPNVSSLIEKVEGGDKKKTAEVKRDGEYSEKDLLKFWDEYKAVKAEEGKDRQVNLMSQPMTIENDVITVVLSNVLLQDMLDDFKTDLMEFLREKLGNDHISIVSVIKEEASERKLYTNREKFDHMLKKNPALKDLQQKLGLDPDY